MDPLQQFNDTLGQWVAFLDDYSLEMICRPTKAAAWSLGQVYQHIIDDTGWYVEQVAAALTANEHQHEPITEEGRKILAHGFPDVQIAGPATNTFIPQPESIDQLRQGLLSIQQSVAAVCRNVDIDSATGKTQHPGLGYFTAGEWLRFAVVHMQHHLRQKKRIDAQLFAGNTVNKSVFIQAPAATVWEMLTNPEKINLWMMDSPVHIQSGWKAGSPLVFTGDLHGIPYINKGVILAFEPEQLLSYTHWSSLSERPDEPEQYGIITFRLNAADTGTMLDFTQTNTGKYATDRHINYYWGTALALIKKRCEAAV
ncbi:SRPBCC domain-containing protein [Chitinophaga oryzae]|uniref:SRPBCC domain-containing protein n=1 Tax=Chitinophaga oryzae TaxID=2725414 RepID=A0AAE6ZC52_9BACT|nr:SRPBCC domain-containing protein [Chitinophaga oryzae]QJB30113.1 SRPBCC domain-containing protein [Chitinophaga oryzae]QJB36611.1 SRPBCC domain-containing protein [Chitinophaga oryzae]